MSKNAVTTISFNGNLLNKAVEAGDSLCMAAFIALSYYVPHKRFAVNQIGEIALKLGVSPSQLYRYICDMKRYDLIKKVKGKYYISSIKQIHQKYGGLTCVSAVCPVHVIHKGIKDIQELLLAIPIISCGKAQIRVIEQKENYVQIKQAKNRPYGKVTRKELRTLRKFEAKCGSDFCVNKALRLSIKGIMALLGCSQATAIKRKRHLVECGILLFQRQTEVLLENVSMEDARYVRSQKCTVSVGKDFDENLGVFTSFVDIPTHFRYNPIDRCIYVDRCSIFELSYLNKAV